MPAYGVAHLVGEALASLQRADPGRVGNAWVVDDGAPGRRRGRGGAHTSPILESIPRHQQPRGGRARNRRSRSTPRLTLTLLDGDDLLRPDYFAHAAAALDADPAAGMVTCNGRVFGAVPRQERFSSMQGGRDEVTRDARRRARPAASTSNRLDLPPRDWERLGGFDETMTHCEDFDLWVRLLLGSGATPATRRGARRIPRAARVGFGQRRQDDPRPPLRIRKALAAVGEGPEAAIAREMIARNRSELGFEWAVDRVLAGDTRGALMALRHARAGEHSVVWPAALALWDLFPSLAAPMLRWRRRANSRRAVAREVAPLDEAAA